MVKSTVRQNIIDFVAGVTLALVIFLTWSEGSRLYRLWTFHTLPAEAFFEPIQLNVPNFVQGDDPTILYDRVIHQEFTANWVVEVQLIQSNGMPVAVCSGDGQSIYQPEKGLPVNGATLSWFMNTSCDLTPGDYRVVATWIIDRPEAVGNVSTRIVSNVFQVADYDARN